MPCEWFTSNSVLNIERKNMLLFFLQIKWNLIVFWFLNFPNDSELNWAQICSKWMINLKIHSDSVWCTEKPKCMCMAAHTEKTIFQFPFKLNGIWSWWQFSFRFLNQMEYQLVRNRKENCHGCNSDLCSYIIQFWLREVDITSIFSFPFKFNEIWSRW